MCNSYFLLKHSIQYSDKWCVTLYWVLLCNFQFFWKLDKNIFSFPFSLTIEILFNSQFILRNFTCVSTPSSTSIVHAPEHPHATPNINYRRHPRGFLHPPHFSACIKSERTTRPKKNHVNTNKVGKRAWNKMTWGEKWIKYTSTDTNSTNWYILYHLTCSFILA